MGAGRPLRNAYPGSVADARPRTVADAPADAAANAAADRAAAWPSYYVASGANAIPDSLPRPSLLRADRLGSSSRPGR